MEALHVDTVEPDAEVVTSQFKEKERAKLVQITALKFCGPNWFEPC